VEIRHLRYFLAVGEALNFTKAAARLRVAQPALSRQIQDLENEIGVTLLRRSSRGVMLTAEGKLFLEEVRELLKRADESVEKVRGLARGEYGELHIGYAPVPTTEILPPALAAFQKAVPPVRVLLHDLSSDELIDGLRNATLELALMMQPIDEQTAGIDFEIIAHLLVLRGADRCASLCSAEIHPVGKTSGRTTRRSQPERLPGVLSVYGASFPPCLSQTANRGGMRQREFADHGSGVRRDRASDHGLQTRGW